MGNSSSSSHDKRKQQYNNGGGGSSSYGHRSSSSAADRSNSGAPSTPGKPYLVVASPADEPDVITVKWKPPAHDGGSKITGYIVEHRRTISPHWVRATPGKVQQNQLTLSGLEPGWRYQFRVKAVNSLGHSQPSLVSDPVTMTPQRTAVVAPVFVRGIEDRVALENDQVKFEVEFEGTPVPKISWYKDGFELFSNRRQRVNTDNGVSTLYIHQSEYSDEGEIKCSATNRAGHAITKARLRLEAPPMVRLPQDYEEGLLLEQNESMRLKVSVSGRPLPQVTWLHDGEEIRGGDRFEVMHTDKYASLKLACVKRSDRGCYQILAVNPLGEHMASFLVTVTDRPSPPGKVHVSKTSGKSVTLSWKPPEDDGGCKIGSYIIEYNRVGWDMWLKASTSRQLTANLNDLLEGSEYRFRVKAENPYGISLPSEVSEPIFLPDIKRGIYKPAVTASLLSEDEEKLVKIQETEMFEYFGRKSKSPEPPSSKPRKLSVDEVSPPVPKRRKKKTKTDLNGSEMDIYKSCSFLDVSMPETWQQPIEQKDHWGLPPGLNGRTSPESRPDPQNKSLNYKQKGNSTDSLLRNFEPGSAPPISLSSPELGADAESFEEHIRNSYSSSELLYERNLNRFNKYSNGGENSSSEAQKIAIYELDRKNSLRLSPITRRSIHGSEEKSIFSDSDSVQSVVDVSKRMAKASRFMSLTNSSMGEELANDDDDDDDDRIPSTSFAVQGSERRESDDDRYDGGEYVSDVSDEEREEEEEPMNFGSGKRALDQNTSSAFFSTVYCDDEYLSDHKLSDRERSASPAAREPVLVGGIGARKSSDPMSEDSLNSTGSLVDSGASDRSRSIDGDNDDDKEGTNGWKTVENGVRRTEVGSEEKTYRDGIPKYVMLPNPFYRENACADGGNKVTFELSAKPGEIVPPRIPRRESNDTGRSSSNASIPVITVTAETTSSATDVDPSDTGSPKSVLKKIIFAPSFSATKQQQQQQHTATEMTSSQQPPPPSSSSYFDKYNNANSTAFETLRKSPDRDRTALDRDREFRRRRTATDETDHPEMVVVKHYGDIVERYSGVAKKPASKTYLDFEQLKMAAAVEESEPVIMMDDEFRREDEFEVDDDDDRIDDEVDEEPDVDRDPGDNGEPSPTTDYGEEQRFRPDDFTSSPTENRLQVMETPVDAETIPYLKIVGNVSLAMFGYWLYACKDERLSVPIFGFLLVRFFKTQIWDRI